MSVVVPADGAAFPATVPVVIVGAGAAGLVAALAAAEAGADALVLERDPLPRGSTALSAGLIPAAGTRWQAAAGVDDDPARFAADIRAKADGEPDPAAVDALTRAIGPTVAWLADRHGLPFSLVQGFRYPGHSADRMHGLPSRSGAELVDRLLSAVAAAGVEVMTDAQVAALEAAPDGRVVGVVVRRPDGGTERIGCGALVLACGGYGADKALIARHAPEMAEALWFGHPGHQGDAVRWGDALGAATRHLSGHQGHGSVAHPHGILLTWACIAEGGAQVDATGRRFADESRGYSEQAADVLRRPGGIAWTVFDARIAAIARQFEDFRQAEAAGALLAADDWPALAARMGVPGAALAAEMAAVADLKATGGTDRFGRRFAGAPQLTAPLHAVKVTGALFHTQGGLAVDGAARVIRPDGAPLPNLFAAGGAACGVSGTKASGYLSGNGLLSAVGYGALAGRAAAAVVAQATGADRL